MDMNVAYALLLVFIPLSSSTINEDSYHLDFLKPPTFVSRPSWTAVYHFMWTLLSLNIKIKFLRGVA